MNVKTFDPLFKNKKAINVINEVDFWKVFTNTEAQTFDFSTEFDETFAMENVYNYVGSSWWHFWSTSNIIYLNTSVKI